jgi:hypothetical protein
MVGLIGASSLEERLMHLIRGEDPRMGGRARLAAAAALAGAVLAPALLLHVAPAFAQTPPAPSLPASVIPPIPAPPAVAPRLRVEVVPARPKRARLALAAAAPIAPAPALATPSPAAPPAPPAPPAPAMAAPAAPDAPDMRQIETMIDAALAQSDAAREAFVNAHVQAAMMALQAHRAELSAAERERVMANVRQSMETWKSQHLAETMARVRRHLHAALESAEVRKALASDEVRRSLHEAAKAADEARAAQGETAPD